MTFFMWLSITMICGGVSSVGAGIIFMNAHHKNKAIAALPARPQLNYAKRKSPMVVSSKLSSTPARKYRYAEEEEEVVRIPPLPKRKNYYREKSPAEMQQVRRECSTWVLVCWWVTTLFCWFILILQAIVEVIR